MRSFLSSVLLLASILQSTYCFVAPCHKQGVVAERAPALFLFGNNNNKSQAKKAAVLNKKETNKQETKGPMWKKIARVVVTGSPDGISLLGKPQHDWVTGKPMSQPAGHSWTSSYKKKDTNTKK